MINMKTVAAVKFFAAPTDGGVVISMRVPIDVAPILTAFLYGAIVQASAGNVPEPFRILLDQIDNAIDGKHSNETGEPIATPGGA